VDGIGCVAGLPTEPATNPLIGRVNIRSGVSFRGSNRCS
jgi:hypothetical protein